jgi:hypothetical protein
VTLGPLLMDIARPLLPAHPRLDPDEIERVERDLTAFLVAEIGALPLHLAAPFRLALVAFALLPVLRFGRTYRALPPEHKHRVVYAWANAPVAVFRNFVKLVRSCALFAYLDHPLVMANLERDGAEIAATAGEIAGVHAG